MTPDSDQSVPPTENSRTGNNAACRGKHVWVHPAAGWPGLASAEDAPFRLDGVVRNWLTGVGGGGNGGNNVMWLGWSVKEAGVRRFPLRMSRAPRSRIRRPFVIWASWSLHLLHHDRAMMGRFLWAGVLSREVSESGIIEQYPPCNSLCPFLRDPPALQTMRLLHTLLYALPFIKRSPIVSSAIVEPGGGRSLPHI